MAISAPWQDLGRKQQKKRVKKKGSGRKFYADGLEENKVGGRNIFTPPILDQYQLVADRWFG
jgi:hypothetical protein